MMATMTTMIKCDDNRHNNTPPSMRNNVVTIETVQTHNMDIMRKVTTIAMAITMRIAISIMMIIKISNP